MKKISLIILAAALLFIFGCGKKDDAKTFKENEIGGVKIIKNTSDPADPGLRIVPRLLFTIKATDEAGKENFQRVQQLSVAADGSFFVVDPGTYSIKKFDPEGKFILSFGKQGNGPGEFMMLNTGLAVLGNKILIPDPATMGVHLFDLDGVFLKYINTAQKGLGMLVMPDSFSENELLSLNTTVGQKNNQISMNTKLSVFDDNLNVKFELWNKEQLFDPADIVKMMSMSNDYPAYTAGAGMVYLAHSGTDKYDISVYDPSGKELYWINMPYRKIKYTEEEKKEINDAMNNYIDPAAKKFMKDYKFEEEFKRAITGVYLDGAGSLWVEKAFESTGEKDLRKIDIFKDGIYQNTFDLIDENGSNIKGLIKIKNNRIYAVDFENNQIRIYGI